MARIGVPPGMPGILGLLAFNGETGQTLSDLAEVMLHRDGSLSRGDRELIAAYVSRLNRCEFCCDSHSAFAAEQLPGGQVIVQATLESPETAPISDKLRALLAIASEVVLGGRAVTDGSFEAARRLGATDDELHDAVLIAAAFCMFNRYVDGLGTESADPGSYGAMAKQIVAEGYKPPVALPAATNSD